MQYSSHLIIGGVTAAWSVHYDVIAVDSLGILACLLGSLLPDIDHPKSVIGKRTQPLSGLIAKLFGHRGITHSLLMVMMGAWFLLDYLNAPPDWAKGLALGYLSHLCADFLTPAGVPLLWPYRKKFTAPYTVTTGSMQEKIIVMIFLWATILFFIYHHQHAIWS